MDPLTAFSLAGTILQFLDTGSKFLRVAWKLYRAGDDGAEETSDLRTISEDFNRILHELVPPESQFDQHQQNEHVEQSDRGVSKLAKECYKVASELLSLLESLQLTEVSRKRDAVKTAFRLILNEDKITALEHRLDTYRSQFNLHLLFSLQQAARESLEKQQGILDKLGVSQNTNIETQGIATGILGFISAKADHEKEQELAGDLRRALISTLQVASQNSQSPDESAIRHESTINIPERRRKQLEVVFLSRFNYNGMKDRSSRISEAHHTTFQWVFKDAPTEERKWSNLIRWLESNEQLYWITGKAGSGKSTLMKFICESRETRSEHGRQPGSKTAPKSRCHEYLEEWAGSSQLLVASFYFWNSGLQIQTSQEALLLSLLSQLLTARRDILPIVFKTQWEVLAIFGQKPKTWSEAELREKMRLAIEILGQDSKVCLFIDGLDEFNGDPSVLVGLFKSLVDENKHLKICVASRPWLQFEDAFGQKPRLRLEDLTYNDVKAYVTSKFIQDAEFSTLRQREPAFTERLIDNIVTKASGVFLWVELVVTSLLSGMMFGDRVVDLQRRLDTLPGDLEKLYDNILKSLDPFYLEQAAQYFQLVEAVKEPISIVCFSFADEETVTSVLEMPVQRMDEVMLSGRIEAMNRRLNSRCKGLLEVDRGFRDANQSLSERAALTVLYLHRTVKDFIRSGKVQHSLRPAVKSNFDPHLSLCVGNLTYIKRQVSEGQELIRSIHNCLYSAARVQSISEPEMIAVLDDLTRAFPANVVKDWRDSQLSKEGVILDSEWSKRFERVEFSQLHPGTELPLQTNWGNESDEAVLSLAIAHDVFPYVLAKVNSWPAGQKPLRVVTSSLLWDAISTSQMNPRTVEFLLKNKASPYYQIPQLNGGTSTPWGFAVWRKEQLKAECSNIPHEFSRQSNNWEKVLNLMVLHGAKAVRLSDKLRSSKLGGNLLARLGGRKSSRQPLSSISSLSKPEGSMSAASWRGKTNMLGEN